jgi:hypothetical protein
VSPEIAEGLGAVAIFALLFAGLAFEARRQERVDEAARQERLSKTRKVNLDRRDW